MIIIHDVPGPVQWHGVTNETNPDQQTGSGLNFTTVISIITVALLISLLIVISSYERLVVLPQSDANTPTGSSQSVSNASTRRMEIRQEVQSETFSEWYAKKFAKTVSLAPFPTHLACAICLNEFTDEQLVRDISCSHVFHTDCLDEWYARGHNQCPLCKGALCHPNPAHLEHVEVDSRHR
ncbi:hypothetical protein BKA61DRAFT_358832 [Leptodontidium sp. MPI-SDFR-AT-0119]|nr:hypothetical protein BKA61DRAFT_358832 [Leptodontidium sp. MPI-SDFR-AT-0119]